MELLRAQIAQMKREQELREEQEQSSRQQQELEEEAEILRTLQSARSLYVNRSQRRDFSGFISSQLKNTCRQVEETKDMTPLPPATIFVIIDDKKQDDQENRKMDQMIFQLLSHVCSNDKIDDTLHQYEKSTIQSERNHRFHFYEDNNELYFRDRIVTFNQLYNGLKNNNQKEEYDLYDYILFEKDNNVINTKLKIMINMYTPFCKNDLSFYEVFKELENNNLTSALSKLELIRKNIYDDYKSSDDIKRFHKEYYNDRKNYLAHISLIGLIMSDKTYQITTDQYIDYCRLATTFIYFHGIQYNAEGSRSSIINELTAHSFKLNNILVMSSQDIEQVYQNILKEHNPLNKYQLHPVELYDIS